MFDYVSVGEMLIDFTGGIHPDFQNPVFEQNPGGSCANAAVCAAQLGLKSAFIGKVGDDNFGLVCKNVLENKNVDTSYMLMSNRYKTTLAFVHLDENGERKFSFYRDNGADTMLTSLEIPADVVENCKALHFCTVAMSTEPSRSAVKFAVRKAKESGAIISFDPNIRFNLWEDKMLVKKVASEMLFEADVVKLAHEEATFIADMDDPIEAGRKIAKDYNVPLVFVTLGAGGCFSICGKNEVLVPGINVDTKDTTGAGDSFSASAVYKLLSLNADLHNLTQAELLDITRFANAAGAIVVTRMGAIPAMPTLDEVNAVAKKAYSEEN